MAFSDTWLKANNGKERAALEERGDREGLGVRITPEGKITFQIRYRYQGKPRRLDLGSYPLMSYGARCAVLHAFGSESDFHEKNKDAKKFGYHDGGKHGYDPKVDEHLVIIGGSYVSLSMQASGARLPDAVAVNFGPGTWFDGCFSDWNKPVSVQAPTHSVPIATVRGR